MPAGSGGDKAIGDDTANLGRGIGVTDLIIDQHFQARGRMPRLISAVVRNPKHVGVGIDEATAILMKNGTFKVVGRGAVTVIDARKARAPDGVKGSFDGVRLAHVRAGDAYDLNRGSVER